MQQESEEFKYQHILQPIRFEFDINFRDLAANWDINIATELESYLESLDEITVTFDSGKTNIKFAEAALLIQVNLTILFSIGINVYL